MYKSNAATARKSKDAFSTHGVTGSNINNRESNSLFTAARAKQSDRYAADADKYLIELSKRLNKPYAELWHLYYVAQNDKVKAQRRAIKLELVEKCDDKSKKV